jgi:hypothetical protein
LEEETESAEPVRIDNPDPAARPVQAKVWLASPCQEPVGIADVGADGRLSLRDGERFAFAPASGLRVADAAAALGMRLIDPVTADVILDEESPTVAADARVSLQAGMLDGSPIYRVTNESLNEAAVELKAWIEAPGLTPVSILNRDANSSWFIQPGEELQIETSGVLKASESIQPGSYVLKTRLIHPSTGRILAEHSLPIWID